MTVRDVVDDTLGWAREQVTARVPKADLDHRDPDLSVALAHAGEAPEATALWRSWAAFFGLPALAGAGMAPVREPARSLAPPIDRPGDLSTRGRRPRFLARRKLGRPERMGTVHRDEREIIAYE